MTIKGNFHILYASQVISGILTWFLSQRFGLLGFALGFIPFLIGMSLVIYKYQPDEREMMISHRINSYDGIAMGVIAGLIYVAFPDVNWFFALVSCTSITRGIIGMLMFSLR